MLTSFENLLSFFQLFKNRYFMNNHKVISALVTGSGSGIGRAIALKLASAGFSVAAVDIKEEQVHETVKLINDEGGDSFAITADISIQEDINRMISDVTSNLGGLDVLVNNAGVSSASFIESVSDEEIDRVFNINMLGVIKITRAAVPHLKKSKRGRIINISSIEGIRGSGLLPIYSSTKAGVIGLTRSNAIELARFGITVNAVCPGPIQTEMLEPMLADEKYRNKIIRGVPMRRIGTPEDVAGAAAFFASDDASFVTGNLLIVDGGMTVKAL